MGLAEPSEQSDNEEVNDDKDVKVLVVRGKKITTTTTSAIPAGGKLLTASFKMILLEDGQDVNVKKV